MSLFPQDDHSTSCIQPEAGGTNLPQWSALLMIRTLFDQWILLRSVRKKWFVTWAYLVKLVLSKNTKKVSAANATQFPENRNKTPCHGDDTMGNQYPLSHAKGILYLCQDSSLISSFVFFPFDLFVFLPHVTAQVITLCNQCNLSLLLNYFSLSLDLSAIFILTFPLFSVIVLCVSSLLLAGILSSLGFQIVFNFSSAPIFLFCPVVLPVGPPELSSLGEFFWYWPSDLVLVFVSGFSLSSTHLSGLSYCLPICLILTMSLHFSVGTVCTSFDLSAHLTLTFALCLDIIYCWTYMDLDPCLLDQSFCLLPRVGLEPSSLRCLSLCFNKVKFSTLLFLGSFFLRT